MFCPNCGSQMNDNATFCSNCGWKKENSKKSLSMPNVSVFNIQKIVLAIIGLVVVIALIFVVKGVISGRHCKYDDCNNKVYKSGYCQAHYAAVTSSKNAKDVISGKKSLEDAAKDTYNKSFTKQQKEQINDIANGISSFFK